MRFFDLSPRQDLSLQVRQMILETVADRVRALMGRSGAKSDRDFAQLVGLPYSTLKGVLDGTRPSVEKVVAIADACDVSLSWLATGQDVVSPSVDYPAIPRYDVALSAGHGSFVERAEQLDMIPFTAEFFQRRLGRGPKGLAIVDARGDSMEPTISDRDLVMIDTADTQLTPAIWAFTLDDAVLVKRLQPTQAGIIQVASDNPAYAPFAIDRANADGFHLVGRVVWVGRVL